MAQTTEARQEPAAKEALVRRLATRMDLDPSQVESIVEGTIAEIFVPSTQTHLAAAAVRDNNCTNNCRRTVSQ